MALLEDTLFGDLFNLNSNVEVPKRVGLGFSYPDIQVMVVMVNRASTEGSRGFHNLMVESARCWMMMMYDDELQAKCEAVAGKSGGSGVDMLGVTPMFVEVTISV